MGHEKSFKIDFSFFFFKPNPDQKTGGLGSNTVKRRPSHGVHQISLPSPTTGTIQSSVNIEEDSSSRLAEKGSK